VPGRESQDGRVPNSQLELDEAAAILERWAKEAEDRKRKSGPETGMAGAKALHATAWSLPISTIALCTFYA
jgi:hypothetical protein